MTKRNKILLINVLFITGLTPFCNEETATVLLEKLYKSRLNLHAKTPIELYNEIWDYDNGRLRYALNDYDYIKAVSFELDQDKSDFKWYKIMMESHQFRDELFYVLCNKSVTCQDNEYIEGGAEYCLLGLAGSSKIDIDFLLKCSKFLSKPENSGCNELIWKLSWYQNHEKEILTLILERLIEGVHLCEIDITQQFP